MPTPIPERPQGKETEVKYWDDFQSKWGFGDGDHLPPDALALRTVYTYAYNKLAAALGIGERMVPLDRPGMHNCYLLTFQSATVAGDLCDSDPRRFAKGPWAGEWEQPDSHWERVRETEDESQSGDDRIMSVMVGMDCWPPISEFVNGRNDIRWTDLNRWLRRAEKLIKACTEDAENEVVVAMN